MPRPKNQDSPMIKWEVRLTPSDQKPIVFDPLPEDFEVFVACEEGGTPELRLHYHVYCISNRSETYLRNMWNALARATPECKGNAVYRFKKAHDKTIGYIVKSGNVVCRLGWDDRFLEEMLQQSRDYKKGLENTRKQAVRQKENFLATVLKEVAEEVSADRCVTPQLVMNLILQKYDKLSLRFPNRTTLETAVMTLMYRTHPNMVQSWYSRSFEFLSY